MNVFIVYAHPEPQSFNGAMRDRAAATLLGAGHAVTVSDLYAMDFDPRSNRHNFDTIKDPAFLKLQAEELYATDQGGFAPAIEAEIRKLEAADLLVFQFPLWWFGLPAILKGWCDRVLAAGRVYGRGHVYATGRFQGRRALCALTTGGPPEAFAADGTNGDLMGILRPIHRGIFQFLGFEVLAPEVVYAPIRQDDASRAALLERWGQRLVDIDRESPIEVGRYG